MTSFPALCGLAFVLAVSFGLLPRAFAADAPPPPAPQTAVPDQPPPPVQQAIPTDQPPPAAVFVRTLDEEGHGAVVPPPAPQSIGPTIDSVLKVMRKLGMVTASRSDERRVGKVGVSTCRIRGSPYH